MHANKIFRFLNEIATRDEVRLAMTGSTSTTCKRVNIDPSR